MAELLLRRFRSVLGRCRRRESHLARPYLKDLPDVPRSAAKLRATAPVGTGRASLYNDARSSRLRTTGDMLDAVVEYALQPLQKLHSRLPEVIRSRVRRSERAHHAAQGFARLTTHTDGMRVRLSG